MAHFDAQNWPTRFNPSILPEAAGGLGWRGERKWSYSSKFGGNTSSGWEPSRGSPASWEVHRRMVRQALADAQPPQRKSSKREWPAVGPPIPFINAILEADRSAPRKTASTAHRIFARISAEVPDCKVAEVTIRQYVRERKRELGWSSRATCVPQSYQPGQDGQVNWYEAWAELGGE